jgi:phage terminase large subunit GpA-like protein
MARAAKKAAPTTAPTLNTRESADLAHWYDNTDAYLESFATVLRPPSKLALSEWADRYRILSSESSAEPGQWITDKAPYEREIMDAISDPWTPKVVVQKASQVGITDSAILNPVGYHIDEDPCPMLVVQPSIEMAEAFSTDRLAPMLRDSPRLRGKVSDARSRDSSNTLRRKSFKGGFVALGGANSAASLSGRPVRIVLLDEVDRYPASAGTEGNPLQLAIARTTAFWNRKVVIVSSPGLKGVSHIEREMEQSTCEHWYLSCPYCFILQILDWDRIRFRDMTHRCLACGEHAQKFQWLAGRGEWRAHRTHDQRGNKILTRGFYLSGLYNPWIEWDVLVEEFVRAVRANAEGDIEPLKAFRNTRLGQLHEDTGEKVDIDLYKERREVYSSEVPDGVLVLTAGVDVGEYALNYEIVGWGKSWESWGIDYGMIDGDPREDDVWRELDKAVFNRVFTCSDGKKMRVRKMAVDSGHASDFVYAYTKPRQPRAVSIKGEGGLGKPFIKGAGTFTKTNRARLQSLGVDSGKEEIVNRLTVAKVGPGYCHFPKLANGEPCHGYDQEYFKGLTAERRVVKSKFGFKTYQWIKRLSQRNEPFDCRNYAMGAVRIPYQGINVETMQRDIFTVTDAKVEETQFGAQKQRMIAEQTHKAAFGPQPEQRRSKFGAQNGPIS